VSNLHSQLWVWYVRFTFFPPNLICSLFILYSDYHLLFCTDGFYTVSMCLYWATVTNRGSFFLLDKQAALWIRYSSPVKKPSSYDGLWKEYWLVIEGSTYNGRRGGKRRILMQMNRVSISRLVYSWIIS